MAWRNSADGFGLLTRLLHWGMAVLLLGMLLLGNQLASLQPGLANLWLYGLHKGMGAVVLALVLLRLLWHRISPPPPPIGNPKDIEVRLARAAHLAIYLLMLAIPLSGWVASSATGLDVLLFDRWKLPAIAPVSELWEKRGFALHGVLAWALVALIGLHVLGAFKRQIAGDGTLTRMIRGR